MPSLVCKFINPHSNEKLACFFFFTYMFLVEFHNFLFRYLLDIWLQNLKYLLRLLLTFPFFFLSTLFYTDFRLHRLSIIFMGDLIIITTRYILLSTRYYIIIMSSRLYRVITIIMVVLSLTMTTRNNTRIRFCCRPPPLIF